MRLKAIADLIKRFLLKIKVKTMNTCPCCSNRLLRHIRCHEVYWFCRNCWQEMPVWNRKQLSGLPEWEIDKLPREQKVQVPISTSKRSRINGWVGVQSLLSY
jgi:hypothetical protein